MLTLYQREGCPFGARVRRYLTSRNESYRVVNVPKLGSERTELLALTDNPEIPLLLDDDTVVQGSDEILAYLEKKLGSDFGDPAYGLTRAFPGRAVADLVEPVREALASEGFGVLTEIDVQATLKKKLDVDHPPYLILGACNPPLAHQALTAEPAIGLLLPCNVVLAQTATGTAVSAIDPLKMFEVVNRPEIEPLAREVKHRLARALAAI